ncbi:hypothetical protein E1B28_011711 [Marasmius oreades]|uniref:Uncharacterized protein n=1 Tax=Marasmius oreades TaxID=181124 RepID=A0A9P7UQI3_9AGAR|nr:uncharacterized protein E1B28_011711 [Marasmius oreades]KAG7090095.1 hypothetical protein E1B28_011711 [Marasmius oreades]
MEVFTGASKVKIGKGNFSNVGRDQNNYYTTHNNIVQTRGKNKKVSRDLPELSEYTEIKRGDIYKSKDGVCYSWRLCSNGKDDTEMAVYTAELNITGPFGQKKFTVKTYRGRSAMKEWRRDFSRCSKDWLRDVPLFGYDRSSVPSLIFCGELVPVAHIEIGLGWVGLFCIHLLKTSLGCSRNELWMDPTQGRFCRGPIGPKCRDWRDEKSNVIVPSDVEFLQEDVVIRYFASKKNDRALLFTVSYAGHVETLDDIALGRRTQVISTLINSTIAFLENVRWRSWTDCLGKRQRMPDRATRFRLRGNRRKIQVDSVNESVPWLTQASSVFHAHNISIDEDLSSYKLVFSYFKLRGTLQQSKRKRQRRQSLDTPIYFILRPSSNAVYHWSFDPTGQTPLTPDMCKYLGLPFKLSLEVIPLQISWSTKIYKAVRDYQIVRGFDPASTDFAQSFSYPVYDVVPAEVRFQEIVEEQHEIPADLDDVPSLPMVKELDDSFSLASLFYEIEGCSNTSSDASPAQTANSEYTQQGGVVPSILGTLFGSFQVRSHGKQLRAPVSQQL